MNPEEWPVPKEEPSSPAPWSDLCLYLCVSFGLFGLAGWGLQRTLAENNTLTTALMYLTNILIFSGTVWVVGVRRGRLSLKELGFWPPRLPVRWIQIGAAISVLLIPVRISLAIALELWLNGGLEHLADTPRMEWLVPQGPLGLNFLISLVLGGCLVPVAEELLFRGALFTWFRRRYPMWVAILASAALFAMGHMDTASVVLTSFVIGVVNAYLFERSRSLWVPITVHAVNNSLAFCMMYALLFAQTRLIHP